MPHLSLLSQNGTTLSIKIEKIYELKNFLNTKQIYGRGGYVEGSFRIDT